MAEKTMKIVVDDGSVRVPIENMIGEEIGSFCFRPTDTGMYTRYHEAMDRIEDIVKPLTDININKDGEADDGDEESVKALEKAQNGLYELCDYIFNGNFSEAFFGKIAPFSPIGGRFYFEIALENLGEFISQQFKAESKKVTKRVEKYTKDYTKRG